METPFLLCVIFRDQSCQTDKFQMSGKVPAYGTISLIKRLVEPDIIGFPREPSVTKGVGQIPIRQTESICGPHAPLINKNTPRHRGNRQWGKTNENGRREGASVTKPTKPRNPPIKMGGVNIFETSGMRREPGCPGPGKEIIGGPCAKKPASKSGIADQIGLHLRSVYDDVLSATCARAVS